MPRIDMAETTADQFSSAHWRPPGGRRARSEVNSHNNITTTMIHSGETRRQHRSRQRRRRRRWGDRRPLALLSWTASFLIIIPLIACLIGMSDCLPTSPTVDNSEETLHAKGRPLIFFIDVNKRVVYSKHLNDIYVLFMWG